MAIITLARQRGAYGRSVAKKLADTIGARYIDKDIVDSRLEALGIVQKHRDAFDEQKPGFFSAITGAVEEYVTCLKQVLYEESLCGNCVILGRGGQSLFKGVPGTIRVRLIASFDLRCERVAAAEGISLEQARKIVSKIDRNREGFNTFFFDTEWDNPLNYDVVLNTEVLSEQQIIGIISDMAAAVPQTTIEQAIKQLADLARAESIERELLHIRKLPLFFLNVSCKGDKVIVQGIAHTLDIIGQVDAIVLAMPGVSTVDNQLQLGLHGHYQPPM